uniref:(northern house mosquito) hypothetical protein n=2 Tax=Culex pipiens TaxID=7175 RepID=A0A8D8MWI6_CULPI
MAPASQEPVQPGHQGPHTALAVRSELCRGNVQRTVRAVQAGQGLRPGPLRAANVCDARPDTESDPGPQGRQESGAAGADAGRDRRTVEGEPRLGSIFLIPTALPKQESLLLLVLEGYGALRRKKSKTTKNENLTRAGNCEKIRRHVRKIVVKKCNQFRTTKNTIVLNLSKVS